MKFKQHLLVVFFIVACFSCKRIAKIDMDCNGSNLVRDDNYSISMDTTNQLSDIYSGIQKADSLVGLCSIGGGFQDWQLRIAYGFSRSDTVQVVILKKTDDGYKANLYQIKYYIKNGLVDHIAKSVTEKKPVSGWPSFIVKLFDLNITSLPDMSKINGYPKYSDGNTVTVQIADRNSYRIYSYVTPDLAQKTVPQAKKMQQILDVISEELSFKWLN